MAKLNGTQNTGTSFERTVLDEGIYDMKLVKVMGYMRDGTPQFPEPKPAMMMIWSWCDEHGNLYQTDDKQTYDLVDVLGMPTNFAYNEKSGYWKRLSEIAGFAINNDTIALTGHDFGDFILSFEDIIEVISHPDAEKPDKKGKVTAVSVEVNGVEQLGRVCKVVVKKQPGKKDPKKFFNSIGSVMQAEASQPKRPPTRPTAAPVAQAAPAQSAPPARPARPAPAPAGQKPPTEALYDANGEELPY